MMYSLLVWVVFQVQARKKKFGNQLLLRVHVDRMSEGSVKPVQS